MSRFDEQRRDYLMESAQRTNESRFPSYHIEADPAGKRSAIIVIVSACLLTALFCAAPVIVRALMNG